MTRAKLGSTTIFVDSGGFGSVLRTLVHDFGFVSKKSQRDKYI
jgi:hypothetical protein